MNLKTIIEKLGKKKYNYYKKVVKTQIETLPSTPILDFKIGKEEKDILSERIAFNLLSDEYKNK